MSGSSMSNQNPPHLEDQVRGHNKKESDPLVGLVPRMVTSKQVETILDGTINPFNQQPYSPQYKSMLETRKELSVYAQMADFYDMFTKNQIMIVVGVTGSGKTTQIPQFVCYSDLPHKKGMMVACTQPRRIAATSVAKRVADEMDLTLGQEVGYSVRFEDMTEPGTTFLKYMTDGMLLCEAINDPNFSRYSTIILDEAHERRLATDILMGLLKCATKRRPDLRLIITSATLDVKKFQRYFSINEVSPAPLLQVPGRTYPVEIFYVRETPPDYLETAINMVLAIHRTQDEGDILLFLTGQEEIEKTCKRIETEAKYLVKRGPGAVAPLVCIPLYSSLQPEQQERIFGPAQRDPSGLVRRKVIVSTNIAETSLTVDGVVYVVDAGFCKQTVYNPLTRVESLLVAPISKASAEQRAGRAGRTKPGKCFRLYTKKKFTKEFEDQDYPEISRTNFAKTALMLVKMGIKDLVRFDYLDAPTPEMLMRALETLRYLGALDEDGNLTVLGGIMAELPLDPQLAKMLIFSPKFECSNEILTIASMLSVPNVWLRPTYQRKEADKARDLLTNPDSDHLTLLNVYESWIKHSKDPDWSWSNFVSQHSLLEAEKIRCQLESLMIRFDIEPISVKGPNFFQRIREALVCGFFMQVAYKVGLGYVTIKDNQQTSFHPSCGLTYKPEWVLFNEFTLTSRPYIRNVTAINPEWLLRDAATYYDIDNWKNSEAKRLLRNARGRPPGQVKSGWLPSGSRGRTKQELMMKEFFALTLLNR